MAEKVRLGQMSVQELKNLVEDLRKELREHRFNKVIGQAANTARARTARRRIAAALTILREYELGIRQPHGTKTK